MVGWTCHFLVEQNQQVGEARCGRGVTTTPSPERGDPCHLLPSRTQARGSAPAWQSEPLFGPQNRISKHIQLHSA